MYFLIHTYLILEFIYGFQFWLSIFILFSHTKKKIKKKTQKEKEKKKIRIFPFSGPCTPRSV